MNIEQRGCQHCKRKTLMKVVCKCKMVVCFNCRDPEFHECNFDYHAEAKEKLKKDNPSVIAEKMVKI